MPEVQAIPGGGFVMTWPAGVGSVALGVLAVVCLVFAVWQVVQIVRWPEGRKLIRRMDEERKRDD